VAVASKPGVRWYKLAKRSFQFMVRPIRPLMRNHVYTMRSGPARGMKRRGGFMFVPTPRSEEERFLDALEWKGKTVFDVGANIGVMALAFARSIGPTGRVIAFEPNPETVALIEDHIRLNRLANVEVIGAAVGDAPGQGRLVMHHEQRGTASMAPSIVDHFRRLGGIREFTVDVVSLDHVVAEGKCPPPDFVKMDVEGYEFSCLLGMRDLLAGRQPDLLIEMHGITKDDLQTNARNVVNLLQGFGYRIFNVQAGTIVDGPDSENAQRGHLFCSVRQIAAMAVPAA
jgi:FkbM family methyltransferase